MLLDHLSVSCHHNPRHFQMFYGKCPIITCKDILHDNNTTIKPKKLVRKHANVFCSPVFTWRSYCDTFKGYRPVIWSMFLNLGLCDVYPWHVDCVVFFGGGGCCFFVFRTITDVMVCSHCTLKVRVFTLSQYPWRVKRCLPDFCTFFFFVMN